MNDSPNSELLELYGNESVYDAKQAGVGGLLPLLLLGMRVKQASVPDGTARPAHSEEDIERLVDVLKTAAAAMARRDVEMAKVADTGGFLKPLKKAPPPLPRAAQPPPSSRATSSGRPAPQSAYTQGVVQDVLGKVREQLANAPPSIQPFDPSFSPAARAGAGAPASVREPQTRRAGFKPIPQARVAEPSPAAPPSARAVAETDAMPPTRRQSAAEKAQFDMEAHSMRLPPDVALQLRNMQSPQGGGYNRIAPPHSSTTGPMSAVPATQPMTAPPPGLSHPAHEPVPPTVNEPIPATVGAAPASAALQQTAPEPATLLHPSAATPSKPFGPPIPGLFGPGQASVPAPSRPAPEAPPPSSSVDTIAQPSAPPRPAPAPAAPAPRPAPPPAHGPAPITLASAGVAQKIPAVSSDAPQESTVPSVGALRNIAEANRGAGPAPARVAPPQRAAIPASRGAAPQIEQGGPLNVAEGGAPLPQVAKATAPMSLGGHQQNVAKAQQELQQVAEAMQHPSFGNQPQHVQNMMAAEHIKRQNALNEAQKGYSDAFKERHGATAEEAQATVKKVRAAAPAAPGDAEKEDQPMWRKALPYLGIAAPLILAKLMNTGMQTAGQVLSTPPPTYGWGSMQGTAPRYVDPMSGAPVY